MISWTEGGIYDIDQLSGESNASDLDVSSSDDDGAFDLRERKVIQSLNFQ